jgi:hypothetical protein
VYRGGGGGLGGAGGGGGRAGRVGGVRKRQRMRPAAPHLPENIAPQRIIGGHVHPASAGEIASC